MQVWPLTQTPKTDVNPFSLPSGGRSRLPPFGAELSAFSLPPPPRPSTRAATTASSRGSPPITTLILPSYRRQCSCEQGEYSPPATSRCPRACRIYWAARRRLEAFITALPGGHNGCGGSRRGSHLHRHRQRRRWISPFRTPLGSPMSMSSIIGAGDDQVTPASSGVAYATPLGEDATPSLTLASPLPAPQMVVVALDATRDHRDDEIKRALKNLFDRGDILRARDSLLVLGVLHSITHPLGYQTKPFTESFFGTSNQYLVDQVANIAESYKNKLQPVIEMLHNVKISVTLKIIPGAPAKVFIIHEVNSSKASWVVLDRHFRRDFKHLEKHIACKVATFQDNLHVQPLRSIRTNPSNKSTAELKDPQRFAVMMDLSSETVNDDVNDDTRKIPNGCGSFLGLMQLILYAIYRKIKGPAAEVEDAKKGAASVELADATTNMAADTVVVADSKVPSQV